MPVVGIYHHRPFMTVDVIVVIDIQAIGELRFQSRVTLRDI